MPAPEAKANSFNGYVELSRSIFSPEVFGRICDAVQDDVRPLILNPKPASAWLPITHFDSLGRAIVSAAYAGDATRMQEVGRRQLERDTKGIYAFFIRKLSPSFLISKTPAMWQSYYRHNGAMRVAPFSNGADVFVENAAWLPAWVVHALIGALQAGLEASSCQDVRVTITEHERNSAQWRTTWSRV
jgi:hypothetical protein